MIAADPATSRRMIATARLLASDKPGEAFAAIAALDRLLPDGQTLAGVVEAALAPRPVIKVPMQNLARVAPTPPPPVHWGQADYCLGALDLTDWERGFLAGIRRKVRVSAKQLAVLANLYAKATEA